MNTDEHGWEGKHPHKPEIETREAAWVAESERRIDAHEKGKLTARDAADVFADLKKTFRK